MGARSERVKLVDVAEQAGVSVGTVSKVMNGTGNLSPQTRTRILAIAERLGYTPDVAARSMLTGRSYTVGILTSDSMGRFTLPVAMGAEDALNADDMATIICESRSDPIREQHYLRTLAARRVDGIIVTSHSSDTRPSIGAGYPIPVVYVLCASEDPRDVSVLPDDEQGGYDAVTHLLETGRSKVVYLGGPIYHVATEHRMAGAMRALADRGMRLVTDPLLGDFSEAWGREAALRLISAGTDFDAAFCASDQIARGLADGLREAGIVVPNQVGIVGVDNWDVMVEASRPPLTTIDLNLDELGRVGARALMNMVNGRTPAGGVTKVPATLVRRYSTAVV